MKYESIQSIYESLQADAKAKGSTFGQVWHEAEVDGYHLYMADTSFGDGPIFRVIGHEKHFIWIHPRDEWIPEGDESGKNKELILDLASRAEWTYRLNKLDPTTKEKK